MVERPCQKSGHQTQATSLEGLSNLWEGEPAQGAQTSNQGPTENQGPGDYHNFPGGREHGPEPVQGYALVAAIICLEKGTTGLCTDGQHLSAPQMNNSIVQGCSPNHCHAHPCITSEPPPSNQSFGHNCVIDLLEEAPTSNIRVNK